MAKSKTSDTPSNKDDVSSELPKDAENTAPDTREVAQETTSEISASEGSQETVPDGSGDRKIPESDGSSKDVSKSEAAETSDMRDDTDTSENTEKDVTAPDEDVEAKGIQGADSENSEAPDATKEDTADAGQDSDVSDRENATTEMAETETSWTGTTEEKSDAVDETKSETLEERAQESAEPEEKPEPKIIRETQVVKGSIWPGVFGGVIAAVVGFIAGRGDMLDNVLPASMQRPSVDLSIVDSVADQTTALSEQVSQLSALADAQAEQIATLEAAPVPSDDAGSSSEELTAVSDQVAALSNEVVALSDQVAVLEARPVASDEAGASEEALAALQSVQSLEATLAKHAETLAELTAAAETAAANAESEAARILARAALARVEVAIDSGEPFTSALSDLQEVAPVEVPEPLTASAETGVPTLANLQENFPEAARNGLAAARAGVPESEVDGVAGFLRRQLNVRSVVPREGSDPDAVLSRAEAAVRAGDLGTALTELEALPDSARTEMNDWLVSASARKAAQDAAGALAESLSSN